ncbi:UNVERIFIED_CONTAM: hypothetical protein PYX00_008543 [Menopon gallinae]|uniref:Aminopeptidase n=1 Tax=Menopon gallinae TaxID=328185 RepID=A0AAW2HNM9_9NEOP
MKLFVFAVLGLLSCRGAVANSEAEKYLLPGNIIPVHYDLRLNTYMEKFNSSDEKSFQFDGSVRITILTVQDQVKSIVMNIDELNITSAVLSVNGSESIDLGKGVVDSCAQKVTFKLKSPLRRNQTVTLNVTYIGSHSDNMVGFYRTEFYGDMRHKYLLNTHFEPTYARSAFPCFDEPRYKATYNVAVSVSNKMISLGYRVLANTPLAKIEKLNDRHVYHFKKTPLPISSYLIAVHISDYKSTPPRYFNSSYPGTGQSGRKEFRTWGESRHLNTTQTLAAQSTGLALMDIYAKDFAIPYGFDKVDQVGVSGFWGGMENWGLIFYNDEALIAESEERLSMVTLVAHELSHQWFGNLVGCHYWSDIWLKEGFATYFEFFGADKVKTPEVNASLWNLPYRYVIEILQQSALQKDVPGLTHPLTVDVYDPTQIAYYFDIIEYEKGGSVIRMWSHVLGLDTFYKALQLYFRENKEFVSTPQALFSSFDAYANESASKLPDLPGRLFKCWHVQECYPVVTLSINYTDELTYVLTQESFALRKSNSQNLTWDIPISYSTSKNLNFNNTTASHWLRKNESVVIKYDGNDWIVINNQQTGYYRVNYEACLWKRLLCALMDPKTAKLIHEVNRAQIIDDVANLARSTFCDYVTYDFFMDLTNYLDSEDVYYPWKTALNNFRYLVKMLSKDEATYNLFKMHILNITKRTYERLTVTDRPEDTFEDKQLRSEIIYWTCKMGHVGCLENSRITLNGHLSKRSVVPPHLTSTVVCSAVRENDNMWNQLWDMYLKSESVSDKKVLIKD